ncbi:uncharacterized protein LOC134811441 [Bolinopsis microptera]|uniref:uncharacterized protein LOC134811441 n=1 Tax=Bolinopsis microptera TaxID=2820187 RepID=UPI00307A659F
MYCLRNLRRCSSIFSRHGNEYGNHSNRKMSLLRPTIKEKFSNSLLPAIYMAKNNKLPSEIEDRLMLRQQMARNTMGESLLNSIVNSMLRTDYVRSLHMDDTFGSYVILATLHLYPILLRLQQLPTDEVRHLRKKVLVTKFFEDLKIRQRSNKVDLKTRRRALNKTLDVQQTMYVRLDEGLTSLSGKELAGAVARIVYSTRDGGECTMQQILEVTEWLLETIDLLNSYTNEEFVELCVFGDGFDFPLLGEFRPIKPEKLYTWHDVEELGDIPEDLKPFATPVIRKL